ncbi:hypothetical protein AtNW77_Chr5g0097811 [Arabidopsis thaliana]
MKSQPHDESSSSPYARLRSYGPILFISIILHVHISTDFFKYSLYHTLIFLVSSKDLTYITSSSFHLIAHRFSSL